MTTIPFSRPRIDLADTDLVPIDPGSAVALGEAAAAMDPWARAGYPTGALTQYLGVRDPAAHKFAIYRAGILAGGAAVRHPWLRGPYLEFLAVLPGFQGSGIGSAVLDWIEREAVATRQRNLWVCCTSFNESALAFYQRHGYRSVGLLPDLVLDDCDEILLRKFPIGARAGSAR